MVNWASVISSSVTPEAEQPGPHPNQYSMRENALPTKPSTNPNVPRPDVSRCAHCGEREEVGSFVVPFGTAASGHTWLHHRCWPEWYAQRRNQEAEKRSVLGVVCGGENLPNDFDKYRSD